MSIFLKASALGAWLWIAGMMTSGLLRVSTSEDGVGYVWGLLIALAGIIHAAFTKAEWHD